MQAGGQSFPGMCGPPESSQRGDVVQGRFFFIKGGQAHFQDFKKQPFLPWPPLSPTCRRPDSSLGTRPRELALTPPPLIGALLLEGPCGAA